MGTKLLPGQRPPGGVPWVHSAFGVEAPGSKPRRGTPIFGPLPFRGDSLERKKGARELGLKMHLHFLFPNPNRPQSNKIQQGEVKKMR